MFKSALKLFGNLVLLLGVFIFVLNVFDFRHSDGCGGFQSDQECSGYYYYLDNQRFTLATGALFMAIGFLGRPIRNKEDLR